MHVILLSHCYTDQVLESEVCISSLTVIKRISDLGIDWLLHTNCIRLQTTLDGVDMAYAPHAEENSGNITIYGVAHYQFQPHHHFDCIKNGAEEVHIQWDPISIRVAAALSATLVMITNQRILNYKEQLMSRARSVISTIVPPPFSGSRKIKMRIQDGQLRLHCQLYVNKSTSRKRP